MKFPQLLWGAGPFLWSDDAPHDFLQLIIIFEMVAQGGWLKLGVPNMVAFKRRARLSRLHQNAVVGVRVELAALLLFPLCCWGDEQAFAPQMRRLQEQVLAKHRRLRQHYMANHVDFGVAFLDVKVGVGALVVLRGLTISLIEGHFTKSENKLN